MLFSLCGSLFALVSVCLLHHSSEECLSGPCFSLAGLRQENLTRYSRRGERGKVM